MHLRIDHAQPDDAPIIARMVGELLREIMAMVGTSVFVFHQEETEARARSWMTDGNYNVLLAAMGYSLNRSAFWRSMEVLLSIRKLHENYVVALGEPSPRLLVAFPRKE